MARMHILCLCASAATCSRHAKPLPDRVDYNFHAKPILSERCYACHGPDAAARQAGLRLDTKEGLQESIGTSGAPVAVPGSRRNSALNRRVASRDAEFRMPPRESNLSLSDREIAILGKWIEQGAALTPHWSYVAPARPPLPRIRRSDWPRNETDPFVLARLERERIAPSPEATRVALLRRVALDLTAPPSLEKLGAFGSDTLAPAH